MSDSLGQRLLDILFPRKCPFCRQVTNDDTLPCPECQRELPWLVDREAVGRAEFLKEYACALRYQGLVRSCVLRYKFSPKALYAKALGPITAQCAADHFRGRFDLVTWVPLSRKRLRRRGFDQAELLARFVARAFDMEPVSLLRKRDDVGVQSRLKDPAARRANVLGAYSVPNPALAAGRRILLVDDLITTGATVSECARVLLLAGAAEVRAVALAQGGSGK